jgi:hypoxanthine phosphoribosyltransferase
MKQLRLLSWPHFHAAVIDLSHRITQEIDFLPEKPQGIYGEPRGGLPIAVALSHRLQMPLLLSPEPGMIWVDDIVDSGRTRERTNAMLWAAWFSRRPRADTIWVEQCRGDEWLVFPWEDPGQAMRDREAYEKSLEVA